MSALTLPAMPFGTQLVPTGGVRFRLYAPRARSIELVLEPAVSGVPMLRRDDGFFEVVAPQASAGARYRFDIDGLRVPDPASRYQPDGVHGPSAVVDPAAYGWRCEGWSPPPWHETVLYELHVGTFTQAGTYAAAAQRLSALVDLGVTAVELMPLADFPGTRNWGYDGVLPFAPAHTYGTPDDLKAFVDAAHGHGLAVYLDVVYNHFGPEGNYLHAYAPEFYTERYRTPWGAAIDVQGPERGAVRAFFIENAIYWLTEFRFDGLRLDAVHAIYDGAERAFLRELATTVHARVDRAVHLVVENEDNESGLLGAGFRAQWNDDAHHAAHVAVTGQRDGYYSDYATNTIALLGRTLTAGFGYQGEPSAYRNDVPRGEPSAQLDLASFVNFMQNHDQIGNRPFGERITALAPDYAVRAMVATFLLAPPVPLLFMGEEWGASTPFLFFCDFEPELARAVTQGRRAEFASFAAFADERARERIPDPSAVSTFERSTLLWDERAQAPHDAWLAFYRTLLATRRREIAPRIARANGRDSHFVTLGDAGLRATWRLDDATTLEVEANFHGEATRGFSSLPKGFVIFSTHDPTYPDGIAPPWSVRWTID
ncbi:MAG: malto-oligosyltrehalose trehalohydrolase [Vulcanimicrobiaceae bacterium]